MCLLEVNPGSFYDWLGEPVPLPVDWGCDYEVFPDERSEEVQGLRKARQEVQKVFRRMPWRRAGPSMRPRPRFEPFGGPAELTEPNEEHLAISRSLLEKAVDTHIVPGWVASNTDVWAGVGGLGEASGARQVRAGRPSGDNDNMERRILAHSGGSRRWHKATLPHKWGTRIRILPF
ncbi:MAG: hypothetical protein HYX92_22720 [Chloroflexi bacterium]|nr:hypothetical protein [Chloroflexota bacterium]